MENKIKIKVECIVNSTLDTVWNNWIGANHIEKWNNASDDWHTTKAVNNLIIGGQFCYTMAAKDGSFSFDFKGIYTDLIPMKFIAYSIEDGRTVTVDFISLNNQVAIVEIFEAEKVNSIELQQTGWQSILNNFKKYTEKN